MEGSKRVLSFGIRVVNGFTRRRARLTGTLNHISVTQHGVYGALCKIRASNSGRWTLGGTWASMIGPVSQTRTGNIRRRASRGRARTSGSQATGHRHICSVGSVALSVWFPCLPRIVKLLGTVLDSGAESSAGCPRPGPWTVVIRVPYRHNSDMWFPYLPLKPPDLFSC